MVSLQNILQTRAFIRSFCFVLTFKAFDVKCGYNQLPAKESDFQLISLTVRMCIVCYYTNKQLKGHAYVLIYCVIVAGRKSKNPLWRQSLGCGWLSRTLVISDCDLVTRDRHQNGHYRNNQWAGQCSLMIRWLWF